MADTTSLSSFPNNIDTFDRVSDLSVQQGTFAKAKTYKSYIDAENYSQAEQYLKSNPDLARCAVNAGMYNKHSDAIVALEEKALEDREYTKDGLTTMNDRLDTVHSEFSKPSENTDKNTVLLNTLINGTPKYSSKIKGESDILINCNSDKELVISLKKYPVNENVNYYSEAGYNYNGKNVYQINYKPVLNKGWNEIEINLISNMSAPPDDYYNMKIINVSGFINVSKVAQLPSPYSSQKYAPEIGYPLNSSVTDMYWTNGLTIPEGLGISKYPTIYINNNIENIDYSAERTFSADIIVNFIIDN